MISKSNLIYGRNAVKEALRADKVLEVYLARNFSDKTVLDLINEKKIKINYVDSSELDKVSNKGVHQNCAANVKNYEYIDLDSVLSKVKNVENPLILILDGVCDPQNFGAILRSADVFGVNAIIISKHNQVPLNATVAKTSAGAINYVPVCLVSNLNQAIESLKRAGFWVVSSDGQAVLNYNELKYDFKTALVIGSEGFGVSNLVLKNSDYIIKIPMHGKVNSLNASVAAGILLSYIRS